MMHRIHRRRNRRRTWTPKSGSTALIALATCVLLANCGNLTAGFVTGEVTVTVFGDALDGLAPAPQSAAGPLATPPFKAAGDTPEGEVQADFFIFLETATGSSTPLSEDQIRIRLDVQGRQEVDAVDRALVTAAVYTQMRIVFTDIRVEVEDGLIINGVPVVGEVRVELKDTALTVTRPLNLNIGDGDSVFLLIDLNANTWLQAVDPVRKVIAEEAFGDAVSVGVR